MKTLLLLFVALTLSSCASVQRNMENTPSDKAALWFIMSSGVDMIGTGYSNVFWDNKVWTAATGTIDGGQDRTGDALLGMFGVRLAAYLAGWMMPEGPIRDNWFWAWTGGNVVQTTVNMSGVLND